jgi:preprotein translocase subunit SecA
MLRSDQIGRILECAGSKIGGDLRQEINLRAYGQREPLNEYKREAFELFEAMLANLRQHVTSVLSHVELRVEPQPVFAPAGAEPEMAMA